MAAQDANDSRIAGSVGIVARRYYTFGTSVEPFRLENKQTLSEVTVCYEQYGELNAARDNAILITHGLTGSSHAAGRYAADSKFDGYWDALIGPGKLFDTEEYCLIAPNVLGGCRGSTGPASLDPRTGEPYGLKFPIVTIRDMARVQKRLLDSLGIAKLKLVIGGSMGGMQALEWAVAYPDFMEAVCAIAASPRNSAQAIAFNECMRRAIMLDPNFQKGEYYAGAAPNGGLSLARMIGTITYLSDSLLQEMFGRKPAMEATSVERDLHARFDVERFLHEEGDKLTRRFDANSYLYLTRAIDLHDICRGCDFLDAALSKIRARMLLVGISSDILYPPEPLRELDAHLKRLNVDSTFWRFESNYGHDAFLVEQEKMIPVLREFLNAASHKFSAVP